MRLLELEIYVVTGYVFKAEKKTEATHQTEQNLKYIGNQNNLVCREYAYSVGQVKPRKLDAIKITGARSRGRGLKRN